MNGPVVLLGEALMSLASPIDRPLDRGSSLDLTFAGAEVNVAIGLARLGHRSRWLSVLGDDAFGSIVLRGLRGEGVDVSFVQTSSAGPTALMVKSPRPGGEPEVFYYRKGSAVSRASSDVFPEASWADAQAIYLTGITPALSHSCREMVTNLINDAYERGIPVWFDPNHRRKLWSEEEARSMILPLLPKMHIVLAGTGEGLVLTGSTEPRTIGSKLLELGAPRVVVKAAGEGTWFFGPEGEIHAPAFPIVNMVDPVGAGDGFGAGVLSARLEGLGWQEAIVRGNALGAIVCQTRGDWEGLPTQSQLNDFLSKRHDAVR